MNGQIFAVDSEYGYAGGRDRIPSAWRPVVFCAIDWRSGERFHFWRDDARLHAWINAHRSALFLAHNLIAEAQYLAQLGIEIPERWFDTMIAYRYVTNQSDFGRYGLEVAAEANGLGAHVFPDKSSMQVMLGRLEFDWGDPATVNKIVRYCFADCELSGRLYDAQKDLVPADKMRTWALYLRAVAKMELRGIPLDMHLYRQIDAHREQLKDVLRAEVNRHVPVYDEYGTEKRGAFFDWVDAQGIRWPTARSKVNGKRYRSLDNATLKEMEPRHPFIPLFRQAKKSIRALSERNVVIDESAGRHYFTTFPFGTITGRNAPKGFLLGASKWMRWLVAHDDPDMLLIYPDFTGQEIGIAAAESGDPDMRAMYTNDDPHMYFAIAAGAAPTGATQKTHPSVRATYKTVSLGLLYGRTEFGLSKALGLSKEKARAIVHDHRSLFPRYWGWAFRRSQQSMRRGECRTRLGWRAQVKSAKERRTFLNFPIQGAGGDILRSAMIYLDQQNVQVLAPLHDAVLIACHRSELSQVREAVDIAYRQAVDDLYPQFPMRWKSSVFHRYADEDGAPMWRFIRQSLRKIQKENQ